MRVLVQFPPDLTRRNAVERLADNGEIEKRRKILNWLSGDFGSRHEDIRKVTVRNSGRWFLESPEFRHWTRKQAPSSLICSGIRSAPFVLR